MAGAQRTQVYLTVSQRRVLDERARRERRSMAELIREALDRYLSEEPDVRSVVDSTFGALPSIEVASRDEWDLG